MTKLIQAPGVPDFTQTEYHPKRTKYCVCIPIINEGERIIAELKRAQAHDIDKIADIIILDGGSTDGSTDKMKELGVNTLLVKKGAGKQGAQFIFAKSVATTELSQLMAITKIVLKIFQSLSKSWTMATT